MRRFLDWGPLSLAPPSAANNIDVEGIALIDDADGVVARANPFSLAQRTIRFTPVDGGGYRIDLPADAGYDSVAASTGATIPGLGDDDSRLIALPFAFPFFGTSYAKAFVNSDGNLTFGVGDSGHADRSLGRLNAGPPRIAPLFSDLDPSVAGAAVRVFAEPRRVVVSWDRVPVYSPLGSGTRQTFQVRLFADGAIEFAYLVTNLNGTTAVTGIAPGRFSVVEEPVSLMGSVGNTVTTGIAEFFSDVDQIDLAVAAQKFYATHEDSYDYLFFFNAIHLYTNNGSVIAFEDTVRNSVLGYGIPAVDDGLLYGSPRRLQAVMNMGPMEQYPQDPFALMPARAGTGDTGLSILGHEAGHRFLAWISVLDESGSPVMWGRANAHWSFNFDSEASLVEGNRMRDDGEKARPRFTTTSTAEAYSPLDQYLFGLRSAGEVPPVFAALDTNGPANASPPHAGTSFNGRRFDVSIDDVIAVAGPRVPDWTVAQRKYRFGFVMIRSSVDPVPEDLFALLGTYRAQWTQYWDRITSGRSVAEVDQRRALAASIWPDAAIAVGGELTATVSIAAPLERDLSVAVETLGAIGGPSKGVVIPAGETSVSFVLRGLHAGVETVTIRAVDDTFEVVEARVRVGPPI